MISEKPIDIPDTITVLPEGAMVATAVLELDQTPPAKLAVSITFEPTQIALVPVMVGEPGLVTVILP